MDKRIIAGIVIFFFAVTAYAGGLPYQSDTAPAPDFKFQPIKKSAKGRPYIGIIAGASIANIGKLQIDETANPVAGHNKYLPTNKHSSAVLYGINGGYEFKIKSNLLLSLGLGIYQSSNHSSKGQRWAVYPYDPSSNSHEFDYEYKVQSTRLMLETQFAWPVHFSKIKLIPFVSLGAGPALSFANSYQETEVAPVGASVSFKTKTNIRFAYQLGAGISCPFNADQSRLSIAYRYVDLGKAHFNSRADNLPYQLDVGKIKAHEVYLSYTHLFNF